MCIIEKEALKEYTSPAYIREKKKKWEGGESPISVIDIPLSAQAISSMTNWVARDFHIVEIVQARRDVVAQSLTVLSTATLYDGSALYTACYAFVFIFSRWNICICIRQQCSFLIRFLKRAGTYLSSRSLLLYRCLLCSSSICTK